MITQEHIKSLTDAVEALRRAAEELRLRNSPPVQLVSPAAFASMLDCSVSSVLKGMKDGSIPKPAKKLFGGTKGWRWTMDQVKDYIALKSTDVPADDATPAPPYVSVRTKRRSAISHSASRHQPQGAHA